FFFFLLLQLSPRSTLFPYTTLFRSSNTNLPPTDYSPLSDDAIIAQIEAGFSSGALTFDESTLYIVFTGIGVNPGGGFGTNPVNTDRKTTRLNSSHVATSYAAFFLKK